MELRAYQREAAAAITQAWDGGTRSLLLVMATGTGKTVVFCDLARRRVEQGDRVLILAHRDELLEQAADKLHALTGLDAGIEKAGRHAGAAASVVLASMQTMGREKRLARFARDAFGTVIIDEAHHALSNSYKRILGHFNAPRVLGVTATPERGDNQLLAKTFTLAYQYGLADAIKDGWLCPITTQTVPLRIDLRGVRQVAGDFDAGGLSAVLDRYLGRIADTVAERCAGRKTLAFLPLIAISQRFRDICAERGIRAAEVNGQSPDRAETLSRFAAGEYDLLCNSMLLTEGWDCPSVDCVLVLRPTRNRALYQQMIGRGTRTAPGKKDLLLLDFMWLSRRFDPCRPWELVTEDPRLAEMMARLAAQGFVGDLAALQAQAQSDLDAEDESESDGSALEAQQRAMLDAFGAGRNRWGHAFLDRLLRGENVVATADDEPMTPAQRACLEKNGVDPARVQSKKAATQVIGAIVERGNAGLASARQVAILARRGHDPAALLAMTRAEAGRLIGAIARSEGWRSRK